MENLFKKNSGIDSMKQPQSIQKGNKQSLTTGNSICNQKYILSHHIGNGTFGDVYIGVLAIEDKMSPGKWPKEVAIKVQNDSIKNSQIQIQIQILKAIRQDHELVQGFPQVFHFGSQNANYYMVLQLLGPNLQDLLTMCGGKFSLKTSLLLIIQILQKVQYLHSKGYIYRDIKPDNFVMGIQDKSNELYIIDFGLSKRYKDKKTKLFVPYKQNVSMAGTIRYASLNAHLGIQQSRRDDLQAICYLLIYFINGQLPWQGVRSEGKFQKDHLIMETKLKISAKELCQGLPYEIQNIFQYVKSLDYYQDPDYRYITSQLSGLYQRMRYILDFEYDWMILNKNVQYQRGDLKLQLKLVEEEQDQIQGSGSNQKNQKNLVNNQIESNKSQSFSESEISQAMMAEGQQNEPFI